MSRVTRAGRGGVAVAISMALAGCAAGGPVAVQAPDSPPPAAIASALRFSPMMPPPPVPEDPALTPPEPLAKTESIAKVTPPAEPEPPPGPISARLPSGFHNPMPGGVMAGYQADTGLDIAGSPRPVYAIAAGTLDYSEPGHTLWTGPSDTANCVRFELDTPIAYKGRKITHVYYAHLSKLAYLQHEGDEKRRHIEAGELVGVSGIARHSPHLHIGLLLDGDVTQRYWGTFLLADEIRKVLGGYKNGDVLPKEKAQ